MLAVIFGGLQQVRAQKNGESIRVSLNVENQAILSVLESITDQTNILFSYNPDALDENRFVSISVENEELDAVLQNIFPDTNRYERIGYHVILYPPKKGIIEQEKDSILQINDSSSLLLLKNNELVLNDKKENENIFSQQDTGLIAKDCHIIEKTTFFEDMKNFLAALALTAISIGNTVLAQDSIPQDSTTIIQATSDTLSPHKKVAQFSFVTPLGTSWINTPGTIFNFSFNLVGGVTGGVHGLEMATGFNVNRYEVKGAQFAAGFNITGTNQNYTVESKNAQFAAGFNITMKGLSTQFAGGFNFADRSTVQAAAGFNAARHAHAQLAGGANVARKAGAQIAGGANVSDTTVFQMAGGVNVANKSSCQISVVNVTKRGGFQMGIVNVRDTADGVPFGLINIVRKGGVLEFGVEGSEFIHASLTFRSGVRKLYTIWSIGMGFSDLFFAPGFGLGSSFLWKNRIGMNFELSYHQLFNAEISDGYNNFEHYFETSYYNALIRFAPLVNLRIVDHFKIFLGPTFNLMIQNSDTDRFFELPYSFYSYQMDDTKLDFWIGFSGGFKF